MTVSVLQQTITKDIVNIPSQKGRETYQVEEEEDKNCRRSR